MATKEEMIKARKNAYTKGYIMQSKNIVEVFPNPYKNGIDYKNKSGTHWAYDVGMLDARRIAPCDTSRVIEIP